MAPPSLHQGMAPAFPPGLGGSLPSAYQFVRDPQSGQLVVIPSDHLPHFGKWRLCGWGRAAMASLSQTVPSAWASHGVGGVHPPEKGGCVMKPQGSCCGQFRLSPCGEPKLPWGALCLGAPVPKEATLLTTGPSGRRLWSSHVGTLPLWGLRDIPTGVHGTLFPGPGTWLPGAEGEGWAYWPIRRPPGPSICTA